MSCSGTSDCDCGCCAGTSVQTPQQISNTPGLSAVSYRVGTWNSFKESMLARLSSADYPALQALKTRADDDFTIAFLDSTAMVLDILTFYQERLVNESYLRTASQLRSLTELSRLIGYQPAPGVSASTYLAFTLKAAPGQPPNPAAAPITISAGTKVQSVPAQGQTPQTFETSADILAKPDWTALPVQTGLTWAPQTGDTSVYLAGTATQLQPGDLFLIVGDERAGPPSDPTNENWDIRVVGAVTADGQNNRTLVTWSEGLGSGTVTPAQDNPKFYPFRQRATLFGYNAIQPYLLDQTNLSIPGNYIVSNGDWNFDSVDQTQYQNSLIDLDSLYPKIVPESWIALITPDPSSAPPPWYLEVPTEEHVDLIKPQLSRAEFSSEEVSHQLIVPPKEQIPPTTPDQSSTRSPSGLVSLYLVNAITTVARSDFGISAKISRAATDAPANALQTYYDATRQTSALVQSELLAVTEQPLTFPLYGTTISLEALRTDMAAVQVLAISGNRQKIALAPGVIPPTFQPNDNPNNSRSLVAGEILTLTSPPPVAPPSIVGPPPIAMPQWDASGTALTLNVEDSHGRPGTVWAPLNNFVLAPSSNSDPVVSEYALVNQIDSTSDPGHTQFQLANALTYCYDRPSTTVNANVGMATHGQSVTELLGSGSASTPNQSFTLKQWPLTFVQSAAAPSGRLSTLTVPVNGAAWTEVPTLYEQSPMASVYATLNQSDGTTDVLFGDGVEGALLPTGQNNVQAKYRVGSGSAGNVAPGALSTLMDRPLGVSGVTNPEAASGGQDPQSVDDIRTNAPQTVLTLGRAVSITDYQNYAATFAGISKAYASWIPYGPGRGVFLTIAGVGGAEVSQASIATLVASLRNFGNPLISIAVQPYVETLFSFSAGLVIDPAYDGPTVQAATQQALVEAFSFAARSFGQGVSVDEIAALIQGIPGIIASNVTGLSRGPSSQGGDLASLTGLSTTAILNQWLAQQITINRPFTDPPNRLSAYLPIPSTQGLPQPAEILVIDPRPGIVGLGTMS
jgi:Baseplate J-like protein